MTLKEVICKLRNFRWKNVCGFLEGCFRTYKLRTRLQILDIDGTQLLGNDGILVSDAIPMSTFTVIWSIVTDEDDNLYIGVTGTGGGEPAYVFKLDSSGNHLWGSNGINVGSGYSVTILPLSSGEAIVSWFLSGSAVMQKYDPFGDEVWPLNQPIENGSNNTVPANIFELSNGDFIMVFHSITFGINSNLFAQRYDGDGVLQWGSPTQLSNLGTVWNTSYSGLQDGDVIYMGYKASPALRFDSYLQRVNLDGTLPWGINGMDFDTNQTNYEMATRIAYDPGSQYVWSICTYTDTNQSEKGEYIQKFDKDTGARQFTDNAKVIYPISGDDNVHAGALQLLDGLPLFLLKSGFDNSATPTTLSAVYLDENGDFAWPEEARPMATFSANKSRIQFTQNVNGQSVAVFIEDKGNGKKIYAQNILEEILSSNDIEIENSIFYINPVSDNLEIVSKNPINSIIIFNVLGQIITEENFKDSNEILINTHNWDSGIYLTKIITSVGIISKRIIKE